MLLTLTIKGMFLQVAFLGCGLTFLGLMFAIIGLISIQPALQSLRWKPADGVITARDNGRLRYQYSVGDRHFSGSRVAFHGQGTTSRYHNGQKVTVYYDPTAPDRSVLRPGPGLLGYLPLGAGGLFFILGLILGMIAYVVY